MTFSPANVLARTELTITEVSLTQAQQVGFGGSCTRYMVFRSTVETTYKVFRQ